MTGLKALWLVGFLLGCGSDTPFTQLWKTKANEEQIDVLLAKSRIHYDNSEFDEAAKAAEKAYEINPNNEEAAILLANVRFGQAGLDFISLTRKIICKQMIEDEAKKKKGKKLDSCEELLGIKVEDVDTTSSSGASDLLADFSSILSISDADIESMGTRQTPSSNVFSGLELLYPKKPGNYLTSDSPRATVPTLWFVNDSIAILCPFLSPDVLDPDNDARHQCEKSKFESQFPAKANFVFALASLVEAIAFHSVILFKYKSTALLLDGAKSATGTVLGEKIERLDPAKNPELANDYADVITALGEVKNDVNAILDVSSESMLMATLSNLRSVSRGFGAIAGIPKEIITKSEAAITSIGGLAEEFGAQATKLEKQMNEKVTKNLKKYVDKMNQDYLNDEIRAGLTPEEIAKRQADIAEACSLISEITGTTENQPEQC
jgi:hypothetical protein